MFQGVEIHHIREWHVYKTHDERHMISVCAACHDAIQRGELDITDETLYSWKQISRNVKYIYTNLYVEPGPHPQCEEQ
ncbi:MAG: HNH endonuclease [Candidatus Thiodiazotropha endolucinida]